jgi:adenine-specific DNA-methyltransferase
MSETNIYSPDYTTAFYSKDAAKKEIKQLVSDFRNNINTLKSKGFKNSEAQTENDFIRPLFQYLNWNVSNRGLNVHEQVFQLQVTGKTGTDNKRPDYLLRVPDSNTNSMKNVMFVEAKKPIYNLKTEVNYIRQVYQYAYSTQNASDNENNQVRIALLTDFEEFRLFDCQDHLPLERNTLNDYNKHIIKDWTYNDYHDKFDELWDLLEFNNVKRGSLNKWYLTTKKLTENRITPDKLFLEDLREWRKSIALSMFNNDKDIDDYTLTSATLLYMNRLIFIKMLSDRNIEDDYLTQILENIDKSKKNQIKLYESCKSIFQRLDNVYNGSMFAYDKIIDEIEISNSVLKTIFTALKPENSVYTLAAMPVEIIGNVYEIFIAEQIVKKGQKVSIVPKYDEKKAGGVYYTPRYIVEYIVENTLGKKLEECKTPEDVAKIKVLDPACGSGSFLIVAYQKLLDWHKQYYLDELKKWIKNNKNDKYKKDNMVRVLKELNDDTYQIHLSHKLKSEILKNNIFGVDIDQQAVLVTKFSLSMKALEDSTHDEVIEDNTIFREPTIPKLENNIKCGNSLVGSDFYQDNRPSLFNEREKRKLNTFDWGSKEGFDSIIKTGGFDCIIGNPPYVSNKEIEPNQKNYYTLRYKSAKNQFDLYTLFIEKSINLMNKNSEFGFIVPDAILDRSSAEYIRKMIINESKLKTIFNLNNVFADVNVASAIIIFSKNNKNDTKINYIKSRSFKDYLLNNFIQKTLDQSKLNNFRNTAFLLLDNKEFDLVEKINSKGIELFKLAIMGRGEELGKSSDFINSLNSKNSVGILTGENVDRYKIKFSNLYISISNIEKSQELYQKKIVVRQVGNKINASLDNVGFVTVQSIYSIVPNQSISDKYILGIVNSSTINFLYQKLYNNKDIFPRVLLENLKTIPIRNIDLTNKSETQNHDKLVSLVDQMLENQKYLQEAKTESDKKLYQNICDSLDKQIDQLVYKLYDLTDEEIAIVEESN